MSKINILLQSIPKNGIVLDRWLAEHGISNDLKQRYIRSQWLTRLGQGASYRTGDTPQWQDAVATLQQQHAMPLHIGGKTAIEWHGASHFIAPQSTHLYLYGMPGHSLPKWFLQQDWHVTVHYSQTGFLVGKQGTKSYPQENGSALILSLPERAILELLALVPKGQRIEEADYIMENLTGLRPALLQPLLESCRSIKVKRLFFTLAEKAGHGWVAALDKTTIDFGTGCRQIIPGGFLDPTYHITLPRTWKDDETPVF